MFRLRKWYLDCVTADGTAFVAYWARLKWGPLTLKYAGLMHRRDRTHHTATLFAGTEPIHQDGTVTWQCPRLGCHGQWRALDPPLHRTLLETGRGKVEWTCLIPRARTTVALDGVPIEGLGYVERLDLTLPPWELPIQELRWGRFLSERSAVVWIDWRGPRPLTIVFAHGAPVEASAIGETDLAWPTGRLELEPGAVLREGSLGSGPLADAPLIARLAPRAVRRIHESKRIRPGRIIAKQGETENGWAIDEIVRFTEDGR